MSFLWRHIPTDKEHNILLTPAVAFGCRGGEQEDVHRMTQWKRRFSDRASEDTNKIHNMRWGVGVTEGKKTQQRESEREQMWRGKVEICNS